MGSVCFGAYAKIIKKATGQTDEETVIALLGSIFQPLSLKNKNGDPFWFEKKEVSEFMNSKLNVPTDISEAAPRVVDSVGAYFEKNIISKVVINPTILLDSVRQLVQYDVTVLPAVKNIFLEHAKIENLAAFLGEVFLYAVQCNNSFNVPKKTKKASDLSSVTVLRLSDIENYLLAEVNMCCPHCGDPFMKSKGVSAIPEYQIAYIYLLNPTPAQDAVLKTLPLPSYGFDDPQNKIALCLKCKNTYLTTFSEKEYNDLLALKREVSTFYQSRLILNKVEIESDLADIVKKLAAAAPQKDLGKKLAMRGLKVNKKIPPSNTPLRIKITGYVVPYFYYLRDLFGDVSRNSSFNYDLLAQEVKLGCEKLLARGLSQNDIFDELTRWVQKSTRSKNTSACEIVVSYFVQNCEVFDEIS